MMDERNMSIEWVKSTAWDHPQKIQRLPSLHRAASSPALGERMSPSKGTQASEKNELLFQRFGINYSMLPAMFRKGSCVFRDKVEETVKQDGSEKPIKRTQRTVRVDHCDIIGEEFWNEHSDILVED
ncbi:hypothetical protein Taro_039975 [Colocasia esculenta]|uniref:Thg1 C-terminal domain-containing protein n=1 Tax=Colocasia esculenta TaxID=4460 RepID=A0A843WHW6_COLES|nr:hypothetical protein [Colocasia esculenta]